MAVKNYDFKQIAVILGGFPIQGFAEDGLTVAFDEDSFMLNTGADGEQTRSRSNNESALITLRLMQTSESNAVLNNFYQADKAGGTGKFAFLIKDLNGSELHAAEEAWVQKPPEAAFGKESATREWTIRCGRMTSIFGAGGQ